MIVQTEGDDDRHTPDDLCVCVSQVRPAGGPFIPRLNRDQRGRKCVSEMISYSSASHLRDIW